MVLQAANQVVCPGDELLRLPETGEVRVGAGVFLEDGLVLSARGGVSRKTQKGKLWVKGQQKTYIPSMDEQVVGIVKERLPECFKVDINGPFHAELPVTAFENVTRRNIPQLQRGDVVYARVTAADRGLSPAISCVNAMGKSAGMGQLKEGCTFVVSTRLASDLLSKPPHTCLVALGASLKFELAIGSNGWCWIDSSNPAYTILIINTIKGCEEMQPGEVETYVKKFVAKLWEKAT